LSEARLYRELRLWNGRLMKYTLKLQQHNIFALELLMLTIMSQPDKMAR